MTHKHTHSLSESNWD